MNEQHPAIDALSTSVAETTEEAVINALYTAHSIDGRDGHRLEALPLDVTLAILQRYSSHDRRGNHARSRPCGECIAANGARDNTATPL